MKNRLALDVKDVHINGVIEILVVPEREIEATGSLRVSFTWFTASGYVLENLSSVAVDFLEVGLI